MSDVQLSKNFWLSEFTASAIAKAKKLTNNPGPEELENLRYLCTAVLQPLRKALKKSVTVTSGFRSKEVNLLAGGVPNSQHEKGEAADIMVKGMSIEDLARKVFKLKLPVDQCIVEYDQNVIHLSIRRPRLEFLSRARVDEKLVYTAFDAAPKKKARKKVAKKKSKARKRPA